MSDLRLSLIVLLLISGCPSTVFGGVMPIHVYSIDRHSRGPFTHILSKDIEARPAFTDSNSSAAVVWVVRPVPIRASLDHVHPGLILPAFVHSSTGPSVFQRAAGKLLGSQAPTTSLFAQSQVCGSHDAGAPTTTATFPASLLSFVFGSRDNRQSSESAANQISKQRRHVDQYSIVGRGWV